MMKQVHSVAIDGPAGAGKSTIARRAAAELGFIYMDTGAIYRTVAYGVLGAGLDPHDDGAVSAYLSTVHIVPTWDTEGKQHMLLDGEDVTAYIRSPEVSQNASVVAAIARVRDLLLETQRSVAREYSVIMDGRDIGTVVLPDADVKIFLTADAEVRAKRRYDELIAKGQKANLPTILKEIQQRDYQDSHRAIAPLKQARDAVKVDTSNLDIEGVLAEIKTIVGKKISV